MKSSLIVLALTLCFLRASEARVFTFAANSSHIVTYDTSPDGHLTFLSAHQQISSSAWISVYPTYNPYLLLATGTNAADGSGNIALYNINRNNGVLTRRSEQNTSGINPAYVSWAPTGSFALVANYGEGDDNSTGASVTVIPVNQSSQSFGRIASTVVHYGNGTDPARQTGPHPHMVATDYTGQFAFSTDLGTNKIYQYQLLPNGTLVNNTNTFEYVSPDNDGDGPRHFAIHPSHLMAYVVNEMGNTVDVFTYNAKLGYFDSLMQTVETVPPGASSEAAEIAVTSDGKFLYVSNRGFDSITGFYIDPESTDFNLKHISYTTHRISTPRGFAIDPYNRLLLVGCSTTNEIVSFAIQNDGVLLPTGAVTSMAGAIALVIAEVN